MENAVIGVDIGGTNIEIGTVTQDYQVYNLRTVKTAQLETPQDFAALLQKYLTDLPPKYNIQGIGIGAPTANRFNGTIDHAPNLKWKGLIPLKDIIQQYTQLPVEITNDANAVAHAELKLGAGKQFKHFAVLTLGTGLGSGIVVNSQVLYGAHGLAGEFGHTQVDPNGRICNCGRRGCLETYVSIRGIQQTYKELGGKPNLTPKQIFQQAVDQQDTIAFKTYVLTGQILGSKLADLVHIFDLEAIILYGGIANAAPLIIPAAKQEMETQLLTPFKNRVQIQVSQFLNKNAGVLGAAVVIRENLQKP